MKKKAKNIMTYYHQIIMKIRHMEHCKNAGSDLQLPKTSMEDDKLEMYARRIQKLEKQLGREITDFSNWGIISENQYQT